MSDKTKRSNLKYNFDETMELTSELCEFVGAVIGDGSLEKFPRTGRIHITGDRVLDKSYYLDHLSEISKLLFNISPKIYEKENTLRLNIYSKKLFEMMHLRFTIPHGKKAYTVLIPDEILASKKKFINSTIRGVFDTDGGVSFDKRKIYKQPYIRLNHTSASKGLIKQISRVLWSYCINHSIHKKDKTYMIQINGKRMVSSFVQKIGFSNKRHKDKIKKHFQNH